MRALVRVGGQLVELPWADRGTAPVVGIVFGPEDAAGFDDCCPGCGSAGCDTSCPGLDRDPLCVVCGGPFTHEEWDGRHWVGDDDAHPSCCPECAARGPECAAEGQVYLDSAGFPGWTDVDPHVDQEPGEAEDTVWRCDECGGTVEEVEVNPHGFSGMCVDCDPEHDEYVPEDDGELWANG